MKTPVQFLCIFCADFNTQKALAWDAHNLSRMQCENKRNEVIMLQDSVCKGILIVFQGPEHFLL